MASGRAFRVWAGNISSFPREVAETALAHVIGDKADQAYHRGGALEKRRKLMDAWATYCEREQPQKSSRYESAKPTNWRGPL
jgi:hypothetical protein